ncbi:unnamed protein product [Cylicocyclus nassatus]|uniref:Ig-like domain-containing protein n=1 Tax=Cylicocyclus nassatus TaxID=53992 RepID=A0AA36DTN5_CYLNA|nr:unnamed protein product [Cylicocyclus nassatus]
MRLISTIFFIFICNICTETKRRTRKPKLVTKKPVVIVPVYFWPGDKVDLPCLMCELAFVFNGKMKMWGKATNILKFLENPKASESWETASSGNNFPKFSYYPDKLKINYKKLPPFYLQRNGKLSIYRASPASQGVYFCYDSQSRSHTSIFYVVMAMTPPVRMSEMGDVLADGCKGEVDHKLIRANFNWRYHFVPQVRHEAPKQCKHKKTRQKTDFCKEAYSKCIRSYCTLEYCRKEFIVDRFDMNVAVELRWEPWTKCEGNMALQKREAHCYLVRKTGYEIPIANDERVPETLKWMSELNVLFDREPFTSKGIRLYSSLLASLFLDEEVMNKSMNTTKNVISSMWTPIQEAFSVIISLMQEEGRNMKFLLSCIYLTFETGARLHSRASGPHRDFPLFAVFRVGLHFLLQKICLRRTLL